MESPLLFPAIYLADSLKPAWLRWNGRLAFNDRRRCSSGYQATHDRVTDWPSRSLTTPTKLGSRGLENDAVSMATTGQGARRSDMRPGSCMQGVLVPAAGGVGLVVTAYEQQSARSNYNCDKRRSDACSLPELLRSWPAWRERMPLCPWSSVGATRIAKPMATMPVKTEFVLVNCAVYC